MIATPHQTQHLNVNEMIRRGEEEIKKRGTCESWRGERGSDGGGKQGFSFLLVENK